VPPLGGGMEIKMIKILFICHGNICRSTMAQSVLTHMVKQRHIEDRFLIDSAATSREEIGNPPHYGTVHKLRQEGIPLVAHRARQMTRQDYDRFDYLIGMDDANIRNMERIAGGDPEHKIHKLLEYAGSSRAIADPWYTDNFDVTYDDIIEGCEAFLRELKSHGV
jgi:protein-tyrosine phosphatase